MAALPNFKLPDLLDVSQFDDQPRSEEAPRMALELIDEDPNQPRTEFNEETLQELADSIKVSGGVKSPVSLRPHPTEPGRYMLNFGARRLRASRLLGLPDIPYFIDRTADSFDQVIENEQRDGLKPLELALFIKARLAEGMEQQEIARRLGKSKGFISKTAALIEAPDIVVHALRTGKLAGVNEAYELRRLYADHPQAVESWVAAQPEIPRAAIAALREQLEVPAVRPDLAPVIETPAPAPAPAPAQVKTPDTKTPAKPASSSAAVQAANPAPVMPVVMAEYKGQPLALDTATVPPAPGHFYGRRPGSTRRLMVAAADLRLVGFASD
ncbi:ParB/RepB/Spo0J family partition protein [Azohydromonas australica]|uniref:ParB/RepB/Spo0J family partition protein n=1 Tax=Azohydromonas australica TaxID=364039 RepID=UPI0003F96FAF|nr:ParB/RepB/Spo0J family partition protein [Azohydromonas australica]